MGVCCNRLSDLYSIPDHLIEDDKNKEKSIKKKTTEELFVYIKSKESQNCVAFSILANSDRKIGIKRETTKFILKQKTIESTHTKVEEDIGEEQISFIKRIIEINNIAPLFDNDTIEEFIKGFFSFSLKQNTEVYYVNNQAKVFYIIEKGRIELHSADKSIQILGKGDYFGIESFYENKYRKETALVMENTDLLCVSGDYYRSAIAYNNLKQVHSKHSLILKVPIFKFIGTEKVTLICDQLKELYYKQGDKILLENKSQFQAIYLINKGTIDKSKNEKQFFTLSNGNCFGDKHIFFPNHLTEYTFEVTSITASIYQITYEILKEKLSINLEEIVYDQFTRIIKNSERLFHLLYANQKILFKQFSLKHYPNNHIVFSKDTKHNKKICIVLAGHLQNANTKEIVCTESNIYGENIIDAKEDQEAAIISINESLILEAKWDDIVMTSPSMNNVNISEAVQYFKQIPLFSNLSEIQFLEMCSLINKERFKEKEVICKEGIIASKFYIIKKGTVQMFKDTKFVRRIETKGCFGSLPEIYCDILSFTAVSVKHTECYVIDSNIMKLFDNKLTQQIKQTIFLQNINVKLSDLYYVKELGNGRFGEVYLVHNKLQLYALKYAPLFSMKNNSSSMQYYLNEKMIMIQTDNPFITKLVKTFKDCKFIYFLLEYIDGISLRKYIEQNKEKNIKELQFYSAILLSVINYIHQKKILHRDIKPDNIMINKNGYLKLIDFGISKILYDQDSTQTVCGTPCYLAPEIIIGEGYSYSADYWSLGVTMFEIFFGYLPFGRNCKDLMSVYNEILKKKLEIPNKARNKELASFLSLILSKNIIQRLCNYNLLQSHDLFHGFDFAKLNEFSITAPYIPDCFINDHMINQTSVISQYDKLHINEIKEIKKDNIDWSNNKYYQEF